MVVVRHGLCPAARRASASAGRVAPFVRALRAACHVRVRLHRRDLLLRGPSDLHRLAALSARRLPVAEQIHKEAGRPTAVDLRRDSSRLAGVPHGLPRDHVPIPADLLQGLMPRKKGVGSLAAGLPAGRFPRRLICPRTTLAVNSGNFRAEIEVQNEAAVIGRSFG